MQEQGFFSKCFVGKDGFQWWVGQVAPEPTWKNNIPGVPGPDNNHEKGFGERYRVRIMGYQTSDASEVPDDVLPYAYVMYPVTAGGGGRGSSQNANITQGNFVFGFWLDGEDSQTPIIMGVLGYNDYQAVMKSLTPLPDRQSQGTLSSGGTGRAASGEQPKMDLRFIPHSGYLDEEKRGTHDVKANYDTSSLVLYPDILEQLGKDNIANPFAIESATNTNNLTSFGDWGMHEWGKIAEPLDKPEDCEPVPMGKIQKQIQNVIQEIEKVQRSLTDYRYALSGLNADVDEKLAYLSSKASKFVASGMKWIMTLIEQNTINVVNEAMKPLYFALFPNQRPTLKKGVEKANDGIACAFQKVIGSLFSMATEFVSSSIGSAINIGGGGGGGGAVSGMISNVIGQATGAISGVIDSVLGGVSSLVGDISSIGSAASGFLSQILSFLSCDEKQACFSVNDWSMWNGSGSLPKANLDQIVNGAKDVYDSVVNTSENVQNIPQNIENSVNNTVNNVENIVDDVQNLPQNIGITTTSTGIENFKFNVNFENSLDIAIKSSSKPAPNSIVDNSVLFSQFPGTSGVQSRAFVAGTPTKTLRSSVSSFVLTENEDGEFVPVPVSLAT